MGRETEVNGQEMPVEQIAGRLRRLVLQAAQMRSQHEQIHKNLRDALNTTREELCDGLRRKYGDTWLNVEEYDSLFAETSDVLKIPPEPRSRPFPSRTNVKESESGRLFRSR